MKRKIIFLIAALFIGPAVETTAGGADFIRVVVKEIAPQQTAVYGVQENGTEVFVFDESVKVLGLIQSIEKPPPRGKISAATLSRDRRKIFFGIIPRAGHFDWVGIYDVDQKEARYLRTAILETHASWNTDNCRIAFESGSYAGNTSVYIIDVCKKELVETRIDGKTFHEQGFFLNTNDLEIQVMSPGWSADGRSLFFLTKLGFGKSPNFEEWIWSSHDHKLTRD